VQEKRKGGNAMKKRTRITKILAIQLGVTCIALLFGTMAEAQDTFKQAPGYQGVPRTWLWNPVANQSVDTTQYKKPGPYTIGFSNSSISNAWRVAFQHGILWSAGTHKDQIAHFLVTDANDDPVKQISDVQDLINQGVDALIVAPATEDALDPIVGRAMKQGIPVILVDRRVKTDANFVSFVTTSTTAMGRIYAQWLAEKLNGKGNIVYLGGIPGASPGELRHAGAMEVLSRYPDIHVLDMQYTNWNPGTGKSVMAALIQKYGKFSPTALSKVLEQSRRSSTPATRKVSSRPLQGATLRACTSSLFNTIFRWSA
jgi:ABC-type sugar transport system substrate-binding protein